MIFCRIIPKTHRVVEFSTCRYVGPTFTLINLDVHYTHRGDHAPSFGLLLIVCSIILLEFNTYDTRHEEPTIEHPDDCY